MSLNLNFFEGPRIFYYHVELYKKLLESSYGNEIDSENTTLNTQITGTSESIQSTQTSEFIQTTLHSET